MMEERSHGEEGVGDEQMPGQWGLMEASPCRASSDGPGSSCSLIGSQKLTMESDVSGSGNRGSPRR